MTDYLFVTGKLAAEALEKTLARMKPDFTYEVAVLNCSVASFMHTTWISKRIKCDQGYGQVMIPGLCQGDLSSIENKINIPVIRGPKDLKDLPLFFGEKKDLAGYGEYAVQIIAEIVDAHEMPLEDIIDKAEYYRRSGADIIDLGCPAHGGYPGVEKVVAELKKQGFRVSLDTFDPETALSADKAGLDMLLSVNSENLDLARKINARVVVIPDFGEGLASLERNATQLDVWGVPYIMDPILDPLCLGFTASLDRFAQVRMCHPETEILMGLGNLTELTDADSTGINALMAGVAAELAIDYVLTTEVISWARGTVRELDLARRLMWYARDNGIPPKRIDDRLITVKEVPYEVFTEKELRGIQKRVSDRNYRIFTDDRQIYIFNRDTFVSGQDSQEIFERLDIEEAGHAFYLGRELERAALAVRLGKKYVQEDDLRWGYLGEGLSGSPEKDLCQGSDKSLSENSSKNLSKDISENPVKEA